MTNKYLFRKLSWNSNTFYNSKSTLESWKIYLLCIIERIKLKYPQYILTFYGPKTIAFLYALLNSSKRYLMGRQLNNVKNNLSCSKTNLSQVIWYSIYFIKFFLFMKVSITAISFLKIVSEKSALLINPTIRSEVDRWNIFQLKY